MATITGIYDDGITMKSASFQTGGLVTSYWNSGASTNNAYFYGNEWADLIAAQMGVPTNLLMLEWPIPATPPAGDSRDASITYTIDSQRSFTLTTRLNNLGTGFTYPYQVSLNIDCYYGTNRAMSGSITCGFNIAQWGLVGLGGSMIDLFTSRLNNPTFLLYTFPQNSPAEDYDRYEDYDKGFAWQCVVGGTWSDGTTQLWARHNGSIGTPGTELTTTYGGNAYLLRFLWDIQEPKIPTSTPDETFGGYDNSSDRGYVPGLPSADMVLTGLVRLYEPSAAQMQTFSDFLWTTSITLDEIVEMLKKWFINPLESIITINMLPIDYFYDYNTGVSNLPQATNIVMAGRDTGCPAFPCAGNFKQVNCGHIKILPYFKSFLDCNPFTKYTIFLPYVGFREIDSNVLYAPDGADLEVVYNIDIITGVFTCFLHIAKTNAETELDHVLYTYSGNMASQIPVSSGDIKELIKAGASLLESAGLAAASVVAGPATLGPAVNKAKEGASHLQNGGVTISHGGNVQMESGYLGIQYPYLIVERPRESFPEGYMHILGKPSDIGGKLSDFAGFVVVKECHLDGVPATEDEKNEIMRLLQEGVIV